MILRTFIAQHQDGVIDVIENASTISLSGLSDFDRMDWFTGSWMDVEVDDHYSGIVVQDVVSIYDENGQLIYYQAERSPTIEELEAELKKRREAA